MSKKLETALFAAIQSLRAEFAELDIPSFNLRIDCAGRTMEGETKIEFALSKMYGETTRGDSLEAVTTEFLRRNGWQQRHGSLRLSHDGQTRTESNNDD
jgi:hypothetical protein